MGEQNDNGAAPRRAGAVVVTGLAAGLALLLQGCAEAPRDSDDFATISIRADFFVVSRSDDGAVEVAAQLTQAGNNKVYLRLTGDDRLYASNGVSTAGPTGGLFEHLIEVASDVVEMRERPRVTWNVLFVESFPDPEYFALFNAPDRSRPFYVAFLRSHDDSVHDVDVAMPPGFSILSPQTGASIPRADSVLLQWSDDGYDTPMRLEAAAECGSIRYKRTLPVPAGSSDLALSTADIFGQGGPTGECVVVLALARERLGLAPAVFAPGSLVRGMEVRSVTFWSTP